MKVLDFTPFRRPLSERGVLAVEAFLAPDFITEFSLWNHDRIYFVRRGELQLEHSDGFANLSQNEILYLPAATWHRWKASRKGHVALLFICFKPEFFATTGPVATLLDEFIRLFPENEAISPERSLGSVSVRQALAAILREKRAQKDEGPAMIIGLFIELIAMLVSARKGNAKLVNPVAKDSAFALSITYLNEHMCDDITVNDLASIAHLSSRRYLDVFKNNFGITPKQYIIAQRIEIAKELMIETGSILHSSLDAGFGNLSHFYRIFKRFTGVTPKQFIARRRDPVAPENRATD